MGLDQPDHRFGSRWNDFIFGQSATATGKAEQCAIRPGKASAGRSYGPPEFGDRLLPENKMMRRVTSSFQKEGRHAVRTICAILIGAILVGGSSATLHAQDETVISDGEACTLLLSYLSGGFKEKRANLRKGFKYYGY